MKSRIETAIGRQLIVGGLKITLQGPADVKIISQKVPVNNGTDVDVLRFIPPDVKSTHTVFYIPGTASAAFCPAADEALCGYMAKIFSCRVISILHRASHLNKFPAPLNDVCGVINFYLEMGAEFGIDPNNISLAGYSSGGLLAIQACLGGHIREDLGIPFRHLLLIAPVASLVVKPRDYTKDAKFMSDEFFKSMVSEYVPSGIATDIPLFSPILHPSEIYNQFVPTTIVYGGDEGFAKDIEQFHALLAEQKVAVKSYKLKGKTHAFPWEESDYLLEIKDRVTAYFNPQPPSGFHYKPASKLPLALLPDLKNHGKLPPFSQLFVRREEEKVLAAKLKSTQFVALCGLPGSGKTQMALSYYRENKKRYHVCWWFNVAVIESNVSFELNRQFKELAIKLNLANTENSVEDCISLVKNWLVANENWLLVFDDLNDEKLLAQYLPSTHKGHVLVTSRERYSKHRLDIQAMNENDAFLLAKKILGDSKIIEGQIKALNNKLGHLPLLIVLVCHDIKKTAGKVFSEYLHHEQFTKPLDDVLKKMSQASPAIIKFLRYCAYLAVNEIPLKFIEKLMGDTFSAEVTGLIYQHSIILKDDNFIALHPAIGEVLRQQMTDQEKIIILNDLNKSIRELPKDIANVKHVKTLLNHIECDKKSLISDLDKTFLAETYVYLAQMSYDFCLMADVIDNGLKAEKYASEQKDPSPQIKAKRVLAAVYWLQGNITEGLSKAREVLKISEDSKDLFETATSSHNLAAWYQRVGDLKSSKASLENAITVFGSFEESKSTYKIKDNKARSHVILGFVNIDLENYHHAIALAKEAKIIWDQLFQESGKEREYQEGLALVYDCLGRAEIYLNNKKAAADHLKKTLEIMHTLYPTGIHRMIASMTLYLAKTHTHLSDACILITDAFKMLFELFKKDNIYLADAYRITGEIFFEHRQYNYAELFFNHALRIMRSDLPIEYFENHCNVKKMRYVLSNINDINKSNPLSFKLKKLSMPDEKTADDIKLIRRALLKHVEVHIQTDIKHDAAMLAANLPKQNYCREMMFFAAGFVVCAAVTPIVYRYFNPSLK